MSELNELLKDIGLIKIKNKKELDHYKKTTSMSKGTYNTGLTSLKQGKPIFIKIKR